MRTGAAVLTFHTVLAIAYGVNLSSGNERRQFIERPRIEGRKKSKTIERLAIRWPGEWPPSQRATFLTFLAQS